MRVLFLTHRLPYAPNRGDRIRAHHILKFLSRHVDVELVSLVHDAEEETHVDDLRALGIEVVVARISRPWSAARLGTAFLTGQPLTHALLDAPSIRSKLSRLLGRRRPDVVLAYCSGMARFALEPPLEGYPFVLDMVDVDSEKWTLLSRTAAVPRRWVYAREARRLAAFEAVAVGRAVETVVVNEREAAAVRALVPAANPRVVPNGVDLGSFEPTAPPADSPRVVFTAVFNYQPNEEGAVWMAREVWPLVLNARPDARLSLVGSSPSAAVRALMARDASIEVTGAVPDVRPYLWQSAVAVAPIAAARGLQNKVLEAIAAGLPCVVTPAVFEGVPDEARAACRVAEDRDTFATAIIQQLASTPSQRRAVTRLPAMTNLAWNIRLRPLLDALAAGMAATGRRVQG